MFPHGRSDESDGGGWAGLVAIAAVALALAAAWKWSPLADMIDAERLAGLLIPWAESPLGVGLAFAGFVLASLAMVPIVVLIAAVGLVFEPMPALGISFVGALASAGLSFAVGRRLPRRIVRKLVGKKLNSVSSKLQGAGAVLPLALLRLVPVAPFTIFNLMAGAVHVPRATFMIATALGLAPGVVALVSIGSGVRFGLSSPNMGPVVLGGFAVVLAVAAALYARAGRKDDGENVAGSPS